MRRAVAGWILAIALLAAGVLLLVWSLLSRTQEYALTTDISTETVASTVPVPESPQSTSSLVTTGVEVFPLPTAELPVTAVSTPRPTPTRRPAVGRSPTPANRPLGTPAMPDAAQPQATPLRPRATPLPPQATPQLPQAMPPPRQATPLPQATPPLTGMPTPTRASETPPDELTSQPDPTPVISVSPSVIPASTQLAAGESPLPSPVPTRTTPGGAIGVQVPIEAGSFTADEALRRYGSIAFNAPAAAQLGKSHMIQLLLDPSGIPPEILGEAISEPGEVRTATIRISDSVEAKLSGAAFEIRAITPEIQAVSGLEATEWRWEIVPKEQGMHRLFLTINALIPSGAGERRRSIRTFDQTIRVEVTGSPLERFGIPAAILLVIAGLVVIVVLDRRGGQVIQSAPADPSVSPEDEETLEMEGGATVPDTPAVGGRFVRRELAEEEIVAGRYVVGRFLGKGGMGAVYAAEDRELGERVALKTMLPAMMGERALQRFRREIQYARRVAHPNVCRIHDLGQHRPADGGEPLLFVSMELVQGRTLSELIRERGRFTESDALPIIEQIAAGLEATHRAGLVHRDIKPANIMVADHPMRVVLMDFGLARLSDPIAREGSITETGALVGSPVYMAPEQLEDTEVSPATDIYAFGAVIYEMVTGGRPFEGANPVSLIAQRLHGKPIPPSRRTPGISSTWEKAILRCLERNPADRFQNVRDLVEQLRTPSSR